MFTKTREQVKSELAEAIRTGDILSGSDTLAKLNELYPDRYRSEDQDGRKEPLERPVTPFADLGAVAFITAAPRYRHASDYPSLFG